MRTLSPFLLLACAGAWAQLELNFNDLGGVDQVRIGESLVGEALQVRIVKPGWGGAWGVQSDPNSLSAQVTEEGNGLAITGTFACEGKPCAFRQVTEPVEGGWRLSYELTPSADLETELVLVQVDLPTEGNAGQGQLYVAQQGAVVRRDLPAEKPDPYHIAGASSVAWIGWLLPGDAGLQIIPDGTGCRGVNFQDNRQFNMNAFQAQFAVGDTRGLQAGRTYSFGLTLKQLNAATLALEESRIYDLRESVEVELASRGPLQLRGVQLPEGPVRAFEKLELDLDLVATFDNPFDPEDVVVDATFTGPDGRTVTVPGFFYQAYDWLPQGAEQELVKVGEPAWKVRFAPPAAGDWQVTVTARDRSGEVRSEPISFTCDEGDDPGFIRRVPDNPYYLQFDDGSPYFAVGENICWTGTGNTRQYDEWFNSLGAVGGNYCRIWLVRWNMALEWTNQGHRAGHYYGLGKYSLDNAYRLDWVMDRARENGIYCMLALGYHGELQVEEDYFKTQCWQWNPYNKVNGGPCESPAEFWTHPEARKRYQQRLRYYVARWGWDTHVQSWEFWNEVTAPAPWVDEMAKYFKAKDPYGHLVTTTYGYDEVWRIPELDYTQAHTYGSDDSRKSTAPVIAGLGIEYTSRWQKPFMVGEFGIDWKASDSKHDPQGLGTSLHNGLWASVMTRSFGTAALWYWDGYVHPKNMYPEFGAVRRFVDAVPWPRLPFEFAQMGPSLLPGDETAEWGDITVIPEIEWGKSQVNDIEVLDDGSISSKRFAQTLFSTGKPDLRTPTRLHVTYPREGRLALTVGTVSANARLVVRIDGSEAWSRELPAGPGEGEWTSTVYREQWGIWQSTYDKEYEITIPAGEHVIELENAAGDWVQVTRYVFRGCRNPRYADVDIWALRTQDFAVGWIQDRRSTWYNDSLGLQPQTIAGLETSLRGLRDGRYVAQWWDTRKGEPVRSDPAVCENGVLALRPPEFLRDIAVQIRAAE